MGNKIKKKFSFFAVKVMLLLSVFHAGLLQPVKADVLGDIITTLSSLTCETQGVGDLLRSEFSHTCIPAPFSTFLIYNIVSPGLYPLTLLRLKINDKELFPEYRDTGGQCARNNRIPYSGQGAQQLSFALCNNIDLAAQRAIAIPKAAIAIAMAFLTGSDPWSDIKDSWLISKSLYHKTYLNQKEGDSGFMFDIGVMPGIGYMPPIVIPVIPWKIIKDNDKMCVATFGFTGWIPVGCKYIKEPFPQSIYSRFMDIDTAPTDAAYENMLESALTRCSGSDGCYQRAYKNSQTGIVITAPLIECIKQMAAKLLVSRDLCEFEDISLTLNNPGLRNSSVLFQFQKNIHSTVTALLTIYVILFGFKIILTGDVPQKTELINFVLKFIFVIYFSVGININAFGGSEYDRLDGMIEWVFPFLLKGMSAMAGWIMQASPSTLCTFDAADYPEGLGYMSLWDSLDCKVSHYLALDVLQTMMVENMSRNHDFAHFDVFSFSIPPYYYLLIPAFITGNMTLVSLALMYPLLVLSVAAYLVNATVICMISIVILGVLAPLFVPMYLFNYTKGFFESWVKLMLSFMLQPMIVVVFMVTLFAVYDFGFYGTCKYTYGRISRSTSEAMTSAVTGGGGGFAVAAAAAGMVMDAPYTEDKKVKIYYVDNNWDSYEGEDAKGCKNSLGYILNNPQVILSSIVFSQGLFITSPKVLFEMVKDLMLALVTACFTLYLMYHFSAQLSEFAADMSGGVSLDSVAIKPQAIFKAGMKILSAAGSSADKVGGGGRKGAGDMMSSIGAPSVADKVSAGVGGRGGSSSARDTTSTGGSVPSASDTTSTGDVPGGFSRTKTAIKPQSEPMKKIVTSDAKDHLSKFFKEKGIDASKVNGLYGGEEFSKYMSFASDPSKFDKVSSQYAATLGQALNDPSMKGHEADFVNRIEGMYSGAQKAEITAVNDKVLEDIKVSRKQPSADDQYVPGVEQKPQDGVVSTPDEKPLDTKPLEVKESKPTEVPKVPGGNIDDID